MPSSPWRVALWPKIKTEYVIIGDEEEEGELDHALTNDWRLIRPEYKFGLIDLEYHLEWRARFRSHYAFENHRTRARTGTHGQEDGQRSAWPSSLARGALWADREGGKRNNDR